MFYIHIQPQPPHPESNYLIPGLTKKSDQEVLIQHQQRQLKKMQQRTRQNYHLERRLFV